MKKKRLEIIRTDKFWKDRVDERIQLLYLDGKNLKTKGFYESIFNVYVFEAKINLADFPEFFDLYYSDFPDDMILMIKIKKKAVNIFNNIAIAKKDGRLHISYPLFREYAPEYKPDAMFWLSNFKKLFSANHLEKTFNMEIAQKDGEIYITLEKIYDDPKQSLGELLNPDINTIDAILTTLKKVNISKEEKLLWKIFND